MLDATSFPGPLPWLLGKAKGDVRREVQRTSLCSMLEIIRVKEKALISLSLTPSFTVRQSKEGFLFLVLVHY